MNPERASSLVRKYLCLPFLMSRSIRPSRFMLSIFGVFCCHCELTYWFGGVLVDGDGFFWWFAAFPLVPRLACLVFICGSISILTTLLGIFAFIDIAHLSIPCLFLAFHYAIHRVDHMRSFLINTYHPRAVAFATIDRCPPANTPLHRSQVSDTSFSRPCASNAFGECCVHRLLRVIRCVI